MALAGGGFVFGRLPRLGELLDGVFAGADAGAEETGLGAVCRSYDAGLAVDEDAVFGGNADLHSAAGEQVVKFAVGGCGQVCGGCQCATAVAGGVWGRKARIWVRGGCH